jgi:hypothetical protein
MHDFSGSGRLQQILTAYRNGVSYPLAGRDLLISLIPQLRDRYPSYADFGASRIEDIFARSDLRQAEVREAYLFASSLAVNDGDGTFDLRPLPVEAQFAPIFSVLAIDLDADGNRDLVVGGNFHGVPPVRGRYDASYGLLLRGNGAGDLQAVDVETSNLMIDGQVRAMELLRRGGGDRLIVVARNDDTLRFIRPLR